MGSLFVGGISKSVLVRGLVALVAVGSVAVGSARILGGSGTPQASGEVAQGAPSPQVSEAPGTPESPAPEPGAPSVIDKQQRQVLDGVESGIVSASSSTVVTSATPQLAVSLLRYTGGGAAGTSGSPGGGGSTVHKKKIKAEHHHPNGNAWAYAWGHGGGDPGNSGGSHGNSAAAHAASGSSHANSHASFKSGKN